MTVKRRSKFSRYRGSHTHGCGSKKKRRGAGNKGGKGMAGSGKRADQKKPTILKLYGNEYFGRKGFHRPQKMLVKVKVINLDDLQNKLNFYISKKLISKEADIYVVDLGKIGYQKLLGGGKLDVKLKVTADHISESAAKKIQEKGGVIVDAGSSK
ncbi:MAG TPA: uL15m family ribosomal protein [Candidatus Nanoarchaeia archaeon]|nr:uL15m family ribosomal protein [Candidatus Nanoarchaeia archaeon]